MFRNDQARYLRERIATEDRLAETSGALDKRRAHADLAFYYRAELSALQARQRAERERILQRS